MERGVLLNGMELIKKYGLVPYTGRPYESYKSYKKILQNSIENLSNQEEQLEQIESIVDRLFFSLPEIVHFEGESYTPSELGKLVKEKNDWISYRFDGQDSARGSWDKHPDPDALEGTKSWKVHGSNKETIIKKALESGHTVGMSFAGHVVLIYGADYDSYGKAMKYYIKDSYLHGASFNFASDSNKTHEELWELSTVDLRNEL